MTTSVITNSFIMLGNINEPRILNLQSAEEHVFEISPIPNEDVPKESLIPYENSVPKKIDRCKILDPRINSNKFDINEIKKDIIDEAKKNVKKLEEEQQKADTWWNRRKEYFGFRNKARCEANETFQNKMQELFKKINEFNERVNTKPEELKKEK